VFHDLLRRSNERTVSRVTLEQSSKRVFYPLVPRTFSRACAVRLVNVSVAVTTEQAARVV
jgi:hypothetical protein